MKEKLNEFKNELIRKLPMTTELLREEIGCRYFLQGLNIKSTVKYWEDSTSDYSWTYVYKYDPEYGFKINHDGHHYYMSEEDMWNILKNTVEVVKSTNKLLEDVEISERIEYHAQPLIVTDFYDVNGEGRGVIATDNAGNEVKFSQSCGTYVRVLTTIQVPM